MLFLSRRNDASLSSYSLLIRKHFTGVVTEPDSRKTMTKLLCKENPDLWLMEEVWFHFHSGHPCYAVTGPHDTLKKAPTKHREPVKINITKEFSCDFCLSTAERGVYSNIFLLLLLFTVSERSWRHTLLFSGRVCQRWTTQTFIITEFITEITQKVETEDAIIFSLVMKFTLLKLRRI